MDEYVWSDGGVELRARRLPGNAMIGGALECRYPWGQWIAFYGGPAVAEEILRLANENEQLRLERNALKKARVRSLEITLRDLHYRVGVAEMQLRLATAHPHGASENSPSMTSSSGETGER